MPTHAYMVYKPLTGNSEFLNISLYKELLLLYLLLFSIPSMSYAHANDLFY